MKEAEEAIKERQRHVEEERKQRTRAVRIATPGARQEPGTPRMTPKRFGL